MPVVGVITPEAHAAVQATGTGGSACSRRRRRWTPVATASSCTRSMRAAELFPVACPRLVPLIESETPFGAETTDAVREYAEPLKAADVDTVILGCTHYPLIRPIFQREFGRGVTLVFSAEETAREVAETLEPKRDRARRGPPGRGALPHDGRPAALPRSRRALPPAAARRRRGRHRRRARGGRRVSRADGRRPDQLRPVTIEPDFLARPHGSALVSVGGTRVLCTATLDDGVPALAVREGQGWLTAEYSMLPASTGDRTPREASQGRQKGRTVEIQRLIGRVVRAVADMEALGERTLWLDCDVLEADGGTRCAAISGVYVAAYRALDRHGLSRVLFDSVAAVSAGIVGGEALVDLDYSGGLDRGGRPQRGHDGRRTLRRGAVHAERRRLRPRPARPAARALTAAIEEIGELQRQALGAWRPDPYLGRRALPAAVAAVLGGLVGFERELREQDAGLRTHMLVSVGSALFTIVSAYGFTEFLGSGEATVRADPTRIAAQIVTGIGFLGAGAIIRRGCPCAGCRPRRASWVVAAIGLARGRLLGRRRDHDRARRSSSSGRCGPPHTGPSSASGRRKDGSASTWLRGRERGSRAHRARGARRRGRQRRVRGPAGPAAAWPSPCTSLASAGARGHRPHRRLTGVRRLEWIP